MHVNIAVGRIFRLHVDEPIVVGRTIVQAIRARNHLLVDDVDDTVEVNVTLQGAHPELRVAYAVNLDWRPER